MRRKISCTPFALLLLLLLILAGCGKDTVDVLPKSDERPIPAAKETKEEAAPEAAKDDSEEAQPEAALDHSEPKRIGREEYGYITVPGSWIDFINTDAAETAIQYSDPTGRQIITLNKAYQPDQTPEHVLTAVINDMKEEGAKDVAGAKVDLNGIASFQAYGYYVEEDIMFIMWAFKTDEGDIHTVSAEAPIGMINEAVEYIEDTYVLN